MIIVTSSFSKSSVFKNVRRTIKRNGAFLNSSGLKSVFEKLRFRDGLVWTVGLTVEIKLRVFKFLRCSVDGPLNLPQFTNKPEYFFQPCHVISYIFLFYN